MKSIMISIQPKWVEKILNGEKTIEIRKTIPKCELPCKVYIYETKGKKYFYNYIESCECPSEEERIKFWEYGSGKVVAEFTLKKTECWRPKGMLWGTTTKKTCLSLKQLIEYADTNNKPKEHCFAWFISDLKVYDKPKDLSDFRKDLDCDDYPCNKNRDCKYNYYDHIEGCWACGIDFDGSNCIYKQLKRPPQSWCYVEELRRKLMITKERLEAEY